METEEKRNEMLFFTFRTKNVNKSKEKKKGLFCGSFIEHTKAKGEGKNILIIFYFQILEGATPV